MCFLIALTLFSSCLLESAAVRYESPYQLNRRDDSNTAHLAGGNYSCSGDEMCPPCFFCEEGHCECGPTLPNDIIVCDETKQTASVMNGNCATYDENRGVTQIGACAYNFEEVKNLSVPLYNLLPKNSTSLNEMMCGSLNRTGALCGRCLPNHYPLAYSFNLTC